MQKTGILEKIREEAVSFDNVCVRIELCCPNSPSRKDSVPTGCREYHQHTDSLQLPTPSGSASALENWPAWLTRPIHVGQTLPMPDITSASLPFRWVYLINIFQSTFHPNMHFQKAQTAKSPFGANGSKCRIVKKHWNWKQICFSICLKHFFSQSD